jgi:glycosyltransferase involved in cell wall biosynthesis
MRITIVQGAFLPVPPKLGGGVEKMWFGLAPEFARRGHEVTYISRRFEGLPNEETLDGVRHIRLPSFDAPLSMLWYRCLDFIYAWRVRFQLPPADILITNTIWLPVLIRDERWGRLCVHVARFPKGQMRLYQHAARLQTVSRAVQTAIAAELPSVAPKVKVIPPYLSSNPPTLTPEELAGPREHWILYLGRIHPEKGLDLLVEAFGRFLAKAPPGEWRLKLVGPSASRMGGGGEKYQAALEAAVSGFRDRVDWLGFVPNEEINALCRRAAIFVYPSVAEKGESFGLAPLEAMALGCPAIVSKLGCFEDFIEDGVTGLVFDHRAADPVSALAERIIDLAHDLPLRQALATRGYAKAQEFTRDKIADRYEEDFRVLKAHADSLPG